MSAMRAADRAYLLLRQEIIAGTLPAGTHLAEADLAAQYNLSRTPIRESLRRLQSEGLVEVIPHRGARVVDWHAFDTEAIYDLRALVEGFVAQRAAVRLDDDALKMLTGLCDQMEELTSEKPLASVEVLSAFADLNEQFHGGVARMSGADHIVPARNILVVLPVIFQALHSYTPADVARSNRHHRELIEAFRSRDPAWAASVMTTHVLSSKARLMERISRGEAAALGLSYPVVGSVLA